jgi:small-conductance mechanosensitive channel
MLQKLSKARDRAVGAVIKKAEKAEEMTPGDGGLGDVKEAARGRHSTAEARGQMNASGAVDLVVGLVVGGLMAAFLLPIAIDEITGVDTSSWDSGAASLWNILPVIMVLAIFLFFVGIALVRSGRLG